MNAQLLSEMSIFDTGKNEDGLRAFVHEQGQDPAYPFQVSYVDEDAGMSLPTLRRYTTFEAAKAEANNFIGV